MLANQRLKLFYLAKIFREKTDSEHMLTINEIIFELSKQDIPADRRTIGSDIELLQNYGMDIVKKHIKSILKKYKK